MSQGPDLVALSNDPARRLRDACEPIAAHAFWSRSTNRALAGLGLKGFQTYICGRAAALGVAEPAVVASAFAWFEPSVIAEGYEAGAGVASRADVISTRNEAATASLREALGEQDPGPAATLLANAVLTADGTGRPLFTGLQAQGSPADPVQRLWWACDAFREHRGDSHLAAANAAGLGPVAMNILTELSFGLPLLSYTATRQWSPHAMAEALAGLERRGWVKNGALTDSGRSARMQVEASTDLQQAGIVETLGSDLDQLCIRLEELSARCIAAGAFPADAAKRAAG